MLKDMPGVREGLPFVLFFFCLCLMCVFLSSVFKQASFTFFSVFFLILSLFTLYFFRDPERTGALVEAANNQQQVLSPADGRILDIRELFEPKYLQYTAKRVSIFMSVFDVHVNRSPVEGEIAYLKYNAGKFISAFKEKASLDNEQVSIGVVKKHAGEPDKKLLFTMIAGLIARRIVLWKNASDSLKRGERVGMIRFGSRVDLYLPQDAEVLVKRGQHVLAGKTVLAYW